MNWHDLAKELMEMSDRDLKRPPDGYWDHCRTLEQVTRRLLDEDARVGPVLELVLRKMSLDGQWVEVEPGSQTILRSARLMCAARTAMMLGDHDAWDAVAPPSSPSAARTWLLVHHWKSRRESWLVWWARELWLAWDHEG